MKRLNTVAIMNNPALKRQAVEWCNRHGINPDIVPIFASVDVVDDSFLELEVYDTTAAGAKQWDEKKGSPKMRWLRVKYSEPLAEELLEDDS